MRAEEDDFNRELKDLLAAADMGGTGPSESQGGAPAGEQLIPQTWQSPTTGEGADADGLLDRLTAQGVADELSSTERAVSSAREKLDEMLDSVDAPARPTCPRCGAVTSLSALRRQKVCSECFAEERAISPADLRGPAPGGSSPPLVPSRVKQKVVRDWRAVPRTPVRANATAASSASQGLSRSAASAIEERLGRIEDRLAEVTKSLDALAKLLSNAEGGPPESARLRQAASAPAPPALQPPSSERAADWRLLRRTVLKPGTGQTAASPGELPLDPPEETGEEGRPAQ